MSLFRKSASSSNVRRSRGRESVLAVNARGGSAKGRERVQKTAALTILCLALLVTGWAAYAGLSVAGDHLFARNERYRIRQIDISTDGTLPITHLREYAGVSEGQNLFAVDIRQIARNIERTPRVRSVEVRRILPDTLSIRVRERIPLARVAEGAAGAPTGVDREGFILGPGVGRGLPIISGVSETGLSPGSVLTDPKTLDAIRLLEICEQSKLGPLLRIQAVNVRHPDYLDVALASGARILLGRDKLEWRLEKLADLILTHRELGLEIETADLTVDRNFPVRTRPIVEARAR
ncbi:MAG: FtsQ-type POTRA domain-containing protein [Kiritimatiellae bacterium]|nr:FtsQ-type POTRA domain-containing protein [Kiritimatiellia bacterium]MDW8458608.1 FtsQ-type POTRA domain-containing protein [Verrucomicrobiota bacterium]